MAKAPFTKNVQLSNALDESLLDNEKPPSSWSQPVSTLPEFPNISLNKPNELREFLKRDMCAPDLERIAPHLWMMATQSSKSISPLHHQKVKNRRIVITEDPRLHLVWIYDRIYIKPLPAYLSSHSFWSKLLLAENEILGAERDIIYRSALGYIRTYAHLIKHPSDFAIAKNEALIPDHVSREDFAAFTSAFSEISDHDVSPRWSYGELRLTRLNFYGKFILRRWDFQRVYTDYGEYFSRFYGPLLFVFTVFSLFLNALQVEMAVEQLVTSGEKTLPSWTGLWTVARYVSVLCLALMIGLCLALLFLLTWFHADEWIYALKDRYRKKNNRDRGLGEVWHR